MHAIAWKRYTKFHNLSDNTHVRSKIYREFCKGIFHIDNEGSHFRMCFISSIIEIRFYIVCLNCTSSYYIAYMVPNVLPFYQYMTSRYKLFIFKTEYILRSDAFSNDSHFE